MSSSAYIIPHGAKTVSAALSSIDPAVLWATSAQGSKFPAVGTTRVFYNTPQDHLTAISSLGDKFETTKGDERRDLVRKSIGSAVKAVKALEGVENIIVDTSLDAHAAAVSAHLADYKFSLKTRPLANKIRYRPVQISKGWEEGTIYAYSQNLARTLMELPANLMTPTDFCARVEEEFKGIKNINILTRDEVWAENMGMRTFLSVTHGTSEPAKLLEIHYEGGSPNDRPLAMIGKGVTFDSGGISLKDGSGMKLMRGDMGGAAAVVASLLAIAKLNIPVNIVLITPLTENMPGPSATKPGDIVYAMNGKTVEVDNTDAEGRLILADAIYYASSTFNPHTLLDVATLTSAMDIAFGEVYTGVFTNSDSLWEELHAAGEYEYDRFWRMPLDEEYGPLIYSSNADLCNSSGKNAGGCTAALFLKAFVKDIEKNSIRWAHIDIAGTMEATRPTPYLETGMTGRSVRAIIEFVRRLK